MRALSLLPSHHRVKNSLAWAVGVLRKLRHCPTDPRSSPEHLCSKARL